MDNDDYFEEPVTNLYPDPVADIAREKFGVTTLYPWQRLVIANIMECASPENQSGSSFCPQVMTPVFCPATDVPAAAEYRQHPHQNGKTAELPAEIPAVPGGILPAQTDNSPEPETVSGTIPIATHTGIQEVYNRSVSPLHAAAGDTVTDILNTGRQIVLLPTGAGKSLCFMVPALLLSRPTLVIYPLLALMSDQMRRLEQAGIEAVVFQGQQTDEQRETNFRKIAAGTKIILANPEVLQSEPLVKRLAGCHIIHAAIDEAHCVSEWGDTFRPAYLTLGGILSRMNIPVITAFTATASAPVLDRITEVLFNGPSEYPLFGNIYRCKAENRPATGNEPAAAGTGVLRDTVPQRTDSPFISGISRQRECTVLPCRSLKRRKKRRREMVLSPHKRCFMHNMRFRHGCR